MKNIVPLFKTSQDQENYQNKKYQYNLTIDLAYVIYCHILINLSTIKLEIYF